MKLLIVCLASAMATVTLPIAPADAGCRITLRAQQPEAPGNGSNHFCVDWKDSQVKVKGGWWKSLQGAVDKALGHATSSSCLDKGESFSFVVELDLGCPKQRQYRFKLRRVRDNQTMMTYVPSGTGYTTTTMVDLGDLRRFF